MEVLPARNESCLHEINSVPLPPFHRNEKKRSAMKKEGKKTRKLFSELEKKGSLKMSPAEKVLKEPYYLENTFLVRGPPLMW